VKTDRIKVVLFFVFSIFDAGGIVFGCTFVCTHAHSHAALQVCSLAIIWGEWGEKKTDLRDEHKRPPSFALYRCKTCAWAMVADICAHTSKSVVFDDASWF